MPTLKQHGQYDNLVIAKTKYDVNISLAINSQAFRACFPDNLLREIKNVVL